MAAPTRSKLVYTQFALTLMVTFWWLIGPAYAVSHSTLIQVNGLRQVLITLSIPLALSILPVIARRTAKLAGVALLAFGMIAGFSIGLPYIPSGVMLLVAGFSGNASSHAAP